MILAARGTFSFRYLRQTPPKLRRQQPNHHSHHHTARCGQCAFQIEMAHQVVHQSADDRRDRIHMLSQNGRRFLTHHIPKDTAAHSGGGAEEDAKERVVGVAGRNRRLGAGYHKSSQTDGI